MIDPTTLPMGTAVIGAFHAATNTGVLKLTACGPNGATVGPNSDLMLGCTPQNEPSNTTTLIINAKTKNIAGQRLQPPAAQKSASGRRVPNTKATTITRAR